jgi:hypothetical protein
MKKILLVFLICSVGIAYLLTLKFRHSSGKIENNLTSQTIGKTQNDKTASKNDQSNVGKFSKQMETVILTNLPEYIQIIMEEYYHLDWETVKQLTPADKNILLRLYRQEPTLVKKRSLTVALGLIGDEEVVEVFKHALSDEYAGRKLTSGAAETDEELVMNATVSVMGFLANKSDSAYDLLKKGVDPQFWKGYCKFVPADDPGFYGALAGDAIKAIGRSGRPDVTNILESLKPLPLVNDLDNTIMRMSFRGGLVDAAFANDMITQRGLDFYKRLYCDLDIRLKVMTEWEKQGNGREWDQWYQKKKIE